MSAGRASPVRWPLLPGRGEVVEAAQAAQRAEEPGAVERAKAEAARQGREEGWREGYRDGHAEGLARGLEDAARELAACMERLEEGFRSAREEMARTAAELALGVARRLLGRIVEEHPDLVRASLEEALAEAERYGEPRVFAHPDLAARIGAEPDPSLSEGGIEVRVDAGGWDASLFGRVDLLRRWLAEGGVPHAC